MLKNRIIPCLDVKNGRVVKGINFIDLKDAGDPVEQVKIYSDGGADEICFLDITASNENRETIFDVVKRTSENCFVPLTVGGGIRSLEDINKLLVSGADKVSINTAAVNNKDLIKGKNGLAARRTKELTNGDFNYGEFGVSGDLIITERQDHNNATEIFKINSKKYVSPAPLTKVNKGIYDSIEIGNVEKRWISTSDGKKMLTWVFFPPNFDAEKKYPTLLYCQGGPQAAISSFYSFRWNFQLMAAKGYIVVAPNRHGVPGFGKEWNEQISNDWGGQAMRDYLAAIDTLAQESYVDENKLGAIGASYGGYSVYMLAGIHNNRFKALISHCGLFNMESWYLSTEEMFFANKDVGGPYWQANVPKAYTEFNPRNFVQNWTAPLLVIHGGKDFRVPVNQGIEAYQAAQLRGIPSRFLHFQNEGHWILNPQNGLVWHSEFFSWLDKWLKD